MRYLILLLVPFFCFAVSDPLGRPSKAPFISGDAFRAYSDYCYDEIDRSLNPSLIELGSVIFVKTDFLGDFFSTIHPLIPVRYILITHNSDYPTPSSFTAYLDDDKLVAWFGQNYDGYSHPKMHPIPMGIANFCWEHGNADLIQEVQKSPIKKIHLAHMQFSIQTFPEERQPVFQQFRTAPFCYHPSNKPFRFYITDLAASKFSIAPRGHAYDTHRIWESLYVGTIPIVKTSSLDSLYEGLPILVIQDWEQVTEQFLEKKYHEFIRQNPNLEKSTMDYWIRLIDSYRHLCFCEKH